MKQSKWGVVVPTIREEQFKEFLKSFGEMFEKHKVTLYVVEDHPTKQIKIPKQKFEVKHYSHKEIEADLKEDAWIIPKQSGSCRSYGFLKAYQAGHEFVLTLDDDTRKLSVDLITQYEIDFIPKMENSGYHRVDKLVEGIPMNVRMRGYPWLDRHTKPIMAQYGMWTDVPDLDAVTTLLTGTLEPTEVRGYFEVVPKYCALTGCIMNAAFRREVIPCMYQLLMGEEYGVDRFDDIWSALFLKKICDVKGWNVAINGYACVQHTRASDAQRNLKMESGGLIDNEYLWEKLLQDRFQRTDSIKLMYEHTAETLFYLLPNYSNTNKLSEAMQTWIKKIYQ